MASLENVKVGDKLVRYCMGWIEPNARKRIIEVTKVTAKQVQCGSYSVFRKDDGRGIGDRERFSEARFADADTIAQTDADIAELDQNAKHWQALADTDALLTRASRRRSYQNRENYPIPPAIVAALAALNVALTDWLKDE